MSPTPVKSPPPLFPPLVDTPKASAEKESEELAKLTCGIGVLRLDSKKFEEPGKRGSVTHLEDPEQPLTTEEETRDMTSEPISTEKDDAVVSVMVEDETGLEETAANKDNAPVVKDTVQDGKSSDTIGDVAAAAIPTPMSKPSAATETPMSEPSAEASAPPSVRLRKFLQNKKASKVAASAETKEPSKPAESSKSLCDTYVPAKPHDWGKLAPVSANQLEAPKPRGRKKKDVAKVEEKPDAKEKVSAKKSKAVTKAKAKRKPKKTEQDASNITKAALRKLKAKGKNQTYEPIEIEGNINEKGNAFDAYAVASAAADVHTLSHDAQPEPENIPKKRRRVARKADYSTEGEAVAATSMPKGKKRTMTKNLDQQDQESTAAEHVVKKSKRRNGSKAKDVVPDAETAVPASDAPASSTRKDKRVLFFQPKPKPGSVGKAVHTKRH